MAVHLARNRSGSNVSLIPADFSLQTHFIASQIASNLNIISFRPLQPFSDPKSELRRSRVKKIPMRKQNGHVN